MSRIDSVNNRGLYGDLLRTFRDKGHQVYIVYLSEKRYQETTVIRKVEGVTFLRVRTGDLMNVNVIKKGIATIALERILLKAVKNYLHDVTFDLILYATPPITLSNVIAYLKKRDNAKTYLLLKDIFPQNAVDLNMLGKGSPLYWYFRQKEQQLYRLSDYIGCMSPANVRYLLQHNPTISADKVEVSPNTISLFDLSEDNLESHTMRNKYQLPHNKVIFMYGGNLGKPQGIDFLIQCIQRNEQNKQSFILVVGSGTEYHKLQQYFDSEKPLNAILFESLPKEDYDLLLSVCDVGLIFLDKHFTIPNFPSRLLSYMQVSLPVLAATDAATDLGEIIETGNFGFSCLSDDVEKFNDLLTKLCSEKLRARLGRNARKYLENHYTSNHSYQIIMKHFG